MFENAQELQAYARKFVASLMPHRDAATLVTLSGDLGAGKTTFTQGIARALGVEETVASPTFVIEKVYVLTAQRWERLVHIDAYRLEGIHHLDAIGWHELIADPGNLIVLEWPERVADAIPESAIKLRFEIQGDGRIITSDGSENAKESGEKNG